MIQVSIGDRWQGFFADAVQTGRYTSVDDVVLEGLRLVQAQEARLLDLRQSIESSLAEGGEVSDQELDAYLDDVDEELKKEGL